MTWTKGLNKRTDHESQIQTASEVSAMRGRWKEEFYQEFEDTINNNEANKYAKAAAWYYVTYDPTERQRRQDTNEDGYFSFPWVVDKIL
ncbi:hypothetical protein BCR42DRAFT_475292, partial [Absidia repens]